MLVANRESGTVRGGWKKNMDYGVDDKSMTARQGKQGIELGSCG
jgi:hypothetical protein